MTVTGQRSEAAGVGAALVVLRDFPVEFREVPRPVQNKDGVDVTVLVSCDEFAAGSDVVGDAAHTEWFVDGAGQAVQHSVLVSVAEEHARERLAALSSRRLAECFHSAFEATVEPLTADETVVAEVNVGGLVVPAVSDEVVAHRVTFSVNFRGSDYSGTRTEGYLDLVAVRTGRATAVLRFTSFVAPPSSRLVAQLVTIAARRLANL